MSRTISRVLYLPSLRSSKCLPFISTCCCQQAPSTYPFHIRTSRPVIRRPVKPIWSFNPWGLPCHWCLHQRGELLPRRFTLTCLRKAPAGGIFSAALSVFSFAMLRRTLPVKKHGALCCPDFPSRINETTSRSAQFKNSIIFWTIAMNRKKYRRKFRLALKV